MLASDTNNVFDTVPYVNVEFTGGAQLESHLFENSPNCIDTGYFSNPFKNVEIMFVYDFQELSVKLYDLNMEDSAMIEEYTLEPTFFLRGTQMFDPETGEATPKTSFEKWANATLKKK